MTVLNESLLLASNVGGGEGGYKIARSLRFNPADTTHLSRTFSAAGNRKTWTWSGWTKKIGTDAYQILFNGPAGTGFQSTLAFNDSDQLHFANYGADYATSTAFIRDPGAWCHVVCSINTLTSDSERIRLFLNGSRLPVTWNTPSGYGADYPMNQAAAHAIGYSNYSGTGVFNGLLAEVHFIDGLALDPTSFGEFDGDGIWQPKEYIGSYPGNSFYLNFADNSSTAALGTDASGNGNDWTANNISVAAGIGNDSFVDTPTDYGVGNRGGDVRGNYCTLNPLDCASLYIENAGLQARPANYNWNAVRGTFGIISGKWYWEYTAVNCLAQVGINTASGVLNNYPGVSAQAYVVDTQDGTKWSNNSNAPYFGAAGGSVIGVAFDADNRTITFYKDGSTPGVAYSGIPAGTYFPVLGLYNYDGIGFINFGQREFTYLPPSGHRALCTTNLPDSQAITTSGSFIGNQSVYGPFVHLNGVPTAMTVNGYGVSFGTHADKLSNGFRIRTDSSFYNASGTNTFSVSSTGNTFKTARAQTSP